MCSSFSAFRIGLVLLCSFSVQGNPPDARVEVGALEERAVEVEGYRTFLRPLFFKQDGKWHDYLALLADEPSAPSVWYERSWHHASKGAILEAVTSYGPPLKPLSAYHAVQSFKPSVNIPVTGRTARFSGWMGGRVQPPRMVCSLPRLTDPDGWHREESLNVEDVSGDVMTVLKDHTLRYHLPPKGSNGDKLGAAAEWIVNVTCHKNQSGMAVFEFILDDELIGDAWEASQIPPEEWNYPNDTPTCIALDAQHNRAMVLGDGLVFLASHDFDADGRTEVVFWRDEYNLNGYTLFDSGLNRLAEYFWHYH